MAYATFCRLAETVTLVNGDASDLELADRIVAAESLLGKLARRPGQFEDFGRQANGPIDAHSGQNAGVLLAGVVKAVATQGRLWAP